MFKLVKKLALIALPIVIYFGIFIYFEPYNYFNLRHDEYVDDSAIVRVRRYSHEPSDIVVLGDSRMAHFDTALASRYAGEDVKMLSFGGASLNESMDLLEFAIETNPDLHTVYFGVSFYTLNENYYKDRMSHIKTIATNPFAYMLNFNYNIEMLNEIKFALMGIKNVAEKDEGHWDESDYLNEDGTPRKYRKNLEEFAVNAIRPVCDGYIFDTRDMERYIELMKLCQEKGIKTYTVLPPVDVSIKDLVIDYLDLSQYIFTFISEVSPYTTVLNYEYPEEPIFTQDEFYDGLHLDVVKGLPGFTQMLFER